MILLCNQNYNNNNYLNLQSPPNYLLNQNLQITDGQSKANKVSAETCFHEEYH